MLPPARLGLSGTSARVLASCPAERRSSEQSGDRERAVAARRAQPVRHLSAAYCVFLPGNPARPEPTPSITGGKAQQSAPYLFIFLIQSDCIKM